MTTYEAKNAMEATHLRVTQEDIERLWTLIADDTSDTRAGIFGPYSISCKVNRESALFLGAGRAALLQLAHPQKRSHDPCPTNDGSGGIRLGSGGR